MRLPTVLGGRTRAGLPSTTPVALPRCSFSVLIASVLFTACDGQIAVPPQPLPQDIRRFVTGDAALALNDAGHFTLPDSVTRPSGQVDEEHAISAAIRYVRTYGRWFVGSWSRERGATVDLARLAPCGHAFYATSPYRALPANVSESRKRYFGPHWIVPICNGPSTEVVVSLSARATELQNSDFVPTSNEGLVSFGVPADIASRAPFTPETAVALAYQITGKRVSGVPVLIQAAAPDAPATSSWVVQLESPVSVRGVESAVRRDRGRLYIGFLHSFFAIGALDVDPRHAVEPPMELTDEQSKVRFSASARPEFPLALELVAREEQWVGGIASE